MRKAAAVLAPWLPWLALAAAAALDALNITRPIPGPGNLYLVGAATTYTATTLICRRIDATRHQVATEIAEALGQATTNEAMLRGYQLAAQHCGSHDRQGQADGRPGESTTIPIPGLRLVHQRPSGTVYGKPKRPSPTSPGRHAHTPQRRLTI